MEKLITIAANNKLSRDPFFFLVKHFVDAEHGMPVIHCMLCYDMLIYYICNMLSRYDYDIYCIIICVIYDNIYRISYIVLCIVYYAKAATHSIMQ